MSNTEALRAACAAMLAALDGMADRNDAGGLMPWAGYLGPYDGTDYGTALDAAMADARAALAQPAASGEPAERLSALRGMVSLPFAWFCEWFNADGSPEWDQYHDRTDPLPADDEWEDRPPDRVTPLYDRPQPLVAPESWQSLAETANRTLERAERRAERNAASEPVAWAHPDGRMIGAATMASAQRDGGAMLSSVRDYTIPLYTAQPAPALVPPGWALVPVEPTSEMLAVNVDPGEYVSIEAARILWRAMLAAAPDAQKGAA